MITRSMQADEKPPRLRVLPQLSELGQYIAEVPFHPSPPVPLFVPGLIQRRGYFCGPFDTNDLDISSPRAKEMGFHGNLGYFREGYPAPPFARARFAVVGTRGETLHLVITFECADAIGGEVDWSDRMDSSDAIWKHWGQS